MDSPPKWWEMYRFDVIFVGNFDKLLNKQSSCWWFKMLLCPCGFTPMSRYHYHPVNIWIKYDIDVASFVSCHEDIE